ncbi:MAG: hypothetical protein FWG64_01785 [Firmicutes bacterium]|nr:hypothetical protein [Bacillota bacterium]
MILTKKIVDEIKLAEFGLDDIVEGFKVLDMPTKYLIKGIITHARLIDSIERSNPNDTKNPSTNNPIQTR